jgi:type I restriction enzyme S subunit
MTVLLTDNLTLLSSATNGIQKLRELILELAVRGKLIPQDPSNEPASELLKRIAEEKSRMVAEGKLKKQKPLVEIGEEEKAFELPHSWDWARFGDICAIKGELVRPEDFPELRQVGPDCIEKGTGRLIKSRTVKESGVKGPNSRFFAGQIVYSKIRPSLSKAILADFDGLCSADMYPIDAFIDSKFLLKEILSEVFLGQVRVAENRIKMPKLNQESLTSFVLAIPPLAEQHRIVAKVDELMSLCDRLEAQQADAESVKARLVQAMLDSLTQASDANDFANCWQHLAEHCHTLFTTEFSIDALKQTLLQLAVMGKLVPQDSMDESGKELSKRIQSSRIDKRKIVTLAEDAVSLLVGELPENWGWSSVDQISADEPRAITDGPFGANLKTEHYIETPGYRVVRLQNIGNGNFRNEHRAYIDQDRFEKIKKHQVLPGDLIVAGLIDTSIRCCIAPEDIGPAVVKADCYRFAAHPLISSKYVLYYLNSKMAREFAAIHHHGLTLTRIGLGNFRNIPVPLPPTDEQHRIVTKLDQLMILCDQLKDRLTKARQLNELLAGTLIEQAVA